MKAIHEPTVVIGLSAALTIVASGRAEVPDMVRP